MPAGTYAPDPDLHVLDTNGLPVIGGLVWTYLAGTTSPIQTFADVGLSVPNPNPIVADGAGRFLAFLVPGTAYKFVYELAPPSGSPPLTHGAALFTRDNITAITASSPATDVNGIAGVAGGSINAGQAVYLSDGTGGLTAGQWYPTNATNAYQSSTPTIIGIAVNAITAGTGGLIRLSGTVTVPGITFVVGGRVYLSNTPGAVSNSPGTNQRVVGQAQDATTLIVGAWPTPAASYVPPGNVVLTDGPVVTLDASLGSIFTLTAAGDRTLNPPINPTEGQKIVIRHGASGANRTLTLSGAAGGFHWGTDLAGPLPTTLNGTWDYVGCIYIAGGLRWDVVSLTRGF